LIWMMKKKNMMIAKKMIIIKKVRGGKNITPPFPKMEPPVGRRISPVG
jgi:hypothetical protein